MTKIEVMDNGDEKYNAPQIEYVAAEKPKRKRLTAEERMEALKAKMNAAAKKAAMKAAAMAERRDAAKTKKMALRNQLVDAVMNRAATNQVSLIRENVKIPAVAAKMNQVEKYYQAAKKRYYTRTKKPSPILHEAQRLAEAEGIPAAYIKQTTRNKTAQNILTAARKRYNKNTAKMAKTGKRAAILATILDQHGLDETAVMKMICVRKKAAAK